MLLVQRWQNTRSENKDEKNGRHNACTVLTARNRERLHLSYATSDKLDLLSNTVNLCTILSCHLLVYILAAWKFAHQHICKECIVMHNIMWLTSGVVKLLLLLFKPFHTVELNQTIVIIKMTSFGILTSVQSEILHIYTHRTST